jgi:hypothetical protein
VSDATETTDDYRADIARRNRRRNLESRDYKIMMAMFGILAYSAFANLVAGAMPFMGGKGAVADAILALVLAALYAVAAYRVFGKGAPWWLVALPAVLSILLLLLIWLVNGVFGVIPFLLNVVLLVLIPVRAKTSTALAGA